MSKVFKPRRGSADQVAAFVGETNEVILNTTTNTLHVMDGLTAGGFPLARADEVAQKDAEQDESLAALRALIAEEVAKLLPLDGSRVMTGALGFGPYLGVREDVSADNAGMNISASSSDKKGAYLILRSDNAGGGFILSSRNEAGSASLIGDPAAKTLTWIGKNLVRSVNGVNADAAGNANITSTIIESYSSNNSGYIKFKNGILINWAWGTGTHQGVTCTWVKAFSNANYIAIATSAVAGSSCNYNGAITSKSTTTCFFDSMIDKAASAYFIAIGI